MHVIDKIIERSNVKRSRQIGPNEDGSDPNLSAMRAAAQAVYTEAGTMCYAHVVRENNTTITISVLNVTQCVTG